MHDISKSVTRLYHYNTGVRWFSPEGLSFYEGFFFSDLWFHIEKGSNMEIGLVL